MGCMHAERESEGSEFRPNNKQTHLKTPMTMVISQCFQFSFTVDVKFPRNSMMMIYRVITSSIFISTECK